VRTRLIAVAVLAALAALAVAAPPASARLPATVEGSVPPGGTATFGSPPIEPGAKTMAVKVDPLTPSERRTFNSLQTVLAASKSAKDRFLTCIQLFKEAQQAERNDNKRYKLDVESTPLSSLFLAACIEMAAELSRPAPQPPPPTTARSAQAACPQAAFRIGMRVRGSGPRRSAVLQGTARTARRPALKVSCRRSGDGYLLRVRPRRRGRPLRSVAGDRLRLGFVSPSDATSSVRLAVTFSR
jgi:hypothetical protein